MNKTSFLMKNNLKYEKYIQQNSKYLNVVEYELLAIGASIATAIATIVLVFVLWRTIKQMEATVTLSKIQTELDSEHGQDHLTA